MPTASARSRSLRYPREYSLCIRPSERHTMASNRSIRTQRTIPGKWVVETTEWWSRTKRCTWRQHRAMHQAPQVQHVGKNSLALFAPTLLLTGRTPWAHRDHAWQELCRLPRRARRAFLPRFGSAIKEGHPKPVCQGSPFQDGERHV